MTYKQCVRSPVGVGLVAVLLLALAVGLSACGGGGSSSDSGSTTPPEAGAKEAAENTANAADEGGQSASAEAQPLEAPAAQPAKEAAEAAAEKPVPAPEFTIGMLDYAGVVPVDQELREQAEAASKALGVKLVICDGEGIPTKIAGCGESLVNQGVEAILNTSIDASLWRPGLEKAKAKGIPVINFGGQISPTPLMAASYVPPPKTVGEAMLSYVDAQFAAAGPEAEERNKVVITTFPAIHAVERSKVIEEAAAEEGKDIVGKWNIDATKIEEDTKQKVSAALTQNPDLGLVWNSFAPSAAPAGQAVAIQDHGKEFPERPLVVAAGEDPTVLGAIREEVLDGTIEEPYYPTAWMAIDQFAQYFAREQKIDPDPELKKYDFPFYGFRLITKENVPAEGPLPYFSDFEEFFKTKWGLEFK